MFGSGAVYLDEHCLISVRSPGYEEHVRRLFYKDIQAIVISKSRRFGVSRGWWLAALLFFVSYIFASVSSEGLTSYLWAPPAGFAAVWLYIALRSSCRCRIYTAISSEELVSVRRSWTARRLLSALTPLVESAQGSLPEGWQASVSEPQPIVLTATSEAADHHAPAEEKTVAGAPRVTGAIGLVLLLVLDVVLTSVELSRALPFPAWIGAVLTLIEAVTAVWVLIQNRRLSVNLQRFGMAVLIFLGLAFYAQTMITAVATAQAKHPLGPRELYASPIHHSFLEAYIAISLVLAIAGAIVMLGNPTPHRRPLTE